jgi:hypothetical protein
MYDMHMRMYIKRKYKGPKVIVYRIVVQRRTDDLTKWESGGRNQSICSLA